MRYSIEKINQELKDGWECISDTYTNLDSELTFRCDKGHEFVSNWRKIRALQECPICTQTDYKKNNQTKKPYKKKNGSFRVLALDQATHTVGYSIFDDKKLVYYNSYTVEGEQTERLIKIRDWFISVVEAWNPDYVAFEGIVYDKYSGVTTFEILAYLLGILIVTATDLKCKYKICHNKKWREYCGITGRSRTDAKKSAQLHVKEWYNVEVTDDCADAICIGRYASHEVTPEQAFIF